MKLRLHRSYRGQTYTIGHLYVNGEYFCDTIEDTDRGLDDSMTEAEIVRRKILSVTAIPTGTYHIDMNTVSPKFQYKTWAQRYNGKVPTILSVKGFSRVLIHTGNSERDSEGCVIIGENKVKGQVINSQVTFHKLMSVLLTDKENITITID